MTEQTMDLCPLGVVYVLVFKLVLHMLPKAFTVISCIDILVLPISDCPTLVVCYVLIVSNVNLVFVQGLF